MTPKLEDIRWDGLFSSRPVSSDPSQFAAQHARRSVLITGAGGSIGSALAKAVAKFQPATLVLLDSSEQNLYYIHRDLASKDGTGQVVPVLASVADETAMRDTFARYRPQIVYHAAALKHVPLGEMNPFAVVQTNVFGTSVVAGLAGEFKSERLIMISTDKSVNPQSIMGASKRLAEMIVLGAGSEQARMTSIRLGNVLGSEGSVVPLFLEQIARGGPVTVTDPEVERYFLTIEETVGRIFTAMASCPADAAVVVPVLDTPVRILDLARYLIRQVATGDIPIQFTGLRPGDKMQEEFVAADERVSADRGDGLRWVRCPAVGQAALATGLVELDSAVNARDLASVLAIFSRLIPEYRPTPFLREQATVTERR